MHMATFIIGVLTGFSIRHVLRGFFNEKSKVEEGPRPPLFSTYFVAKWDHGYWLIYSLAEMARSSDSAHVWAATSPGQAKEMMGKLDTHALVRYGPVAPQ